MLRVERRADPGSVPCDALKLAYDDRKKSRLRVWSEARREVGIFLAWGSVLREGDLLAANSGEVLVVRAAPEPLSEVRTRDWHLLTRAAYHLGNRHVALQIEPGILRYQRDHVLDDMLVQMGLAVEAVDAPFEPERGAYGGHSHSHGDETAHAHAHAHVHEDVHVHVHEDEDVHVHVHEDASGARFRRVRAHEQLLVHSHDHTHSHGPGHVHADTDGHGHSGASARSQDRESNSNLDQLLHRTRNS